jgi:hypothetical protein
MSAEFRGKEEGEERIECLFPAKRQHYHRTPHSFHSMPDVQPCTQIRRFNILILYDFVSSLKAA